MNVFFMIVLIVQASACVINDGDPRRQGGGGHGPPPGMGGGPPQGMGGGPPQGMGGGPPQGMGGGPPPGSGVSYGKGPGGDGEPVQYTGYGMEEEFIMTTQDAPVRFHRPTSSTTPGTTKRTIPTRVTDFEEGCDYLAFYCLKAYKTGKLCGRTIYFQYRDFKNYCMLDFVNCMERYEVWQVAHMGECFNLTNNNKLDFQHFEYHDDYFLDQYFVLEI